MITLCTGKPTLEVDGERIITVPSGKDALQIAMTRHQARSLTETGQRKLDLIDLLEQESRAAEIVALHGRRKGRR